MTRFTKLALAAALGGTVLGGTAYAAQDQAPAAPAAAGMHRHHHGHGDRLAKLDTNHDGVITRDEAIAAADAQFAKRDTNGDGQITKDERDAKHDAMRAKMQARRAAAGDQAAPSATPNDGAMGGHRGMHHRHDHGGMMMQRLDTNGDGTITKAEAEAAATQRFDKMDANHDGRIDQAEIQPMKAQHQAKRAEMRAKWQAKRATQSQAAPGEQPAGQ